jgi:mannose-6-phosphate isomerase-like protein (cupin superfamily)
MDSAVDLAHTLAGIDEAWAPHTVAEFNGHDLMVVRARGSFVWHTHDDTDDMFLVLSGRLVVRLRDRDVTVDPGQLYVVPAGVEHQTVACGEATMLLVEPTGTPNTGDAATAAPRRRIRPDTPRHAPSHDHSR